MSQAPASYSMETVRNLLLAAFTPEALLRFCQDHPPFRSLAPVLAADQDLHDMVDRLLAYSGERGLTEQLLKEVQEASPNAYARFESHLGRPTGGPSPQPGSIDSRKAETPRKRGAGQGSGINYYELLGVGFDASREEIRDAAKRLRREFRADRERCIQIAYAKKVLSDPVLREGHNREYREYILRAEEEKRRRGRARPGDRPKTEILPPAEGSADTPLEGRAVKPGKQGAEQSSAELVAEPYPAPEKTVIIGPGAAPKPAPDEGKTQVHRKPGDSKPRAYLQIRHESGRQWEQPLADGETTIGRQASNKIVLKDPKCFVSRQHAAIATLPDGTFCVKDRGSYSGTRVKDQLIPRKKPVPLSDGDVIEIEDYDLTFHLKPGEARPKRLTLGSPDPAHSGEDKLPPQDSRDGTGEDLHENGGADELAFDSQNNSWDDGGGPHAHTGRHEATAGPQSDPVSPAARPDPGGSPSAWERHTVNRVGRVEYHGKMDLDEAYPLRVGLLLRGHGQQLTAGSDIHWGPLRFTADEREPLLTVRPWCAHFRVAPQTHPIRLEDGKDVYADFQVIPEKLPPSGGNCTLKIDFDYGGRLIKTMDLKIEVQRKFQLGRWQIPHAYGRPFVLAGGAISVLNFGFDAWQVTQGAALSPANLLTTAGVLVVGAGLLGLGGVLWAKAGRRLVAMI